MGADHAQNRDFAIDFTRTRIGGNIR